MRNPSAQLMGGFHDGLELSLPVEVEAIVVMTRDGVNSVRASVAVSEFSDLSAADVRHIFGGLAGGGDW